jgi:hypothetical protein
MGGNVPESYHKVTYVASEKPCGWESFENPCTLALMVWYVGFVWPTILQTWVPEI